MFKNRIFIASNIVLILVAVLHFLASGYDLYFYIWWFDTLMHFLGGLWIGLLFSWIFFSSPMFNHWKLSGGRTVLLVVITALIIGAGWEVFEVLARIMDPSDTIYYTFDTFKDLLLDTSGSCVGAIISVLIMKRLS
ncbi:MAG: hypothetical protein WCW14_03610 [Candidatus Paceibacterota bacterium]|jgi:hypothetical protein